MIPETISLAKLLRPIDQVAFLRDYLGSQFLYVAGDRNKVSGLFNWADLNRVLQYSSLAEPRLRLVKEGQSISAESYVKRVRSGNRESVDINVERFTTYLRGGATLVIDQIDRLAPSVERCVGNLERVLRLPVSANVYASWSACSGFDLHWDDPDVVVIQIDGTKEWRVYRPTEVYPRRRRPDEKHPVDVPPTWQGTLGPGDVLYLPRGWWHIASAKNQPSLHLTVGFAVRTAVELMGWLLSKLEQYDCIRQDLPVTQDLDDPNVISGFAADGDVMATPRPQFSLPWGPTQELVPGDDDEKVISLIPSRPLLRRRINEEALIEVSAVGASAVFPEVTDVLFEYLEETRTTSIPAFCDKFAAIFSRDQLRSFCADLVRRGLVAVSEQAR
jgi:hypothetical protein